MLIAHWEPGIEDLQAHQSQSVICSGLSSNQRRQSNPNPMKSNACHICPWSSVLSWNRVTNDDSECQVASLRSERNIDAITRERNIDAIMSSNPCVRFQISSTIGTMANGKQHESYCSKDLNSCSNCASVLLVYLGGQKYRSQHYNDFLFFMCNIWETITNVLA